MNVIVGAGIAGLTCAKVLHEANAPFMVLEAQPRVGGRMQTDLVEGFRLDRGFQVLPTGYPAVRRHLDLDALSLRNFDAGALLWESGDFHRVMHPFFHPEWLLPSALTAAFPVGDRLRLTALAASAALHSDTALQARSASARDETIRENLTRIGFSDTIIRRFFEPFFGGILLDDSLRASAGLFGYYLKKFLTGRAAIPAEGIGSIPGQLAARLPADRLRLGAHAVAVTARGVTLETGEHVAASRVVLATDDEATRRLLGQPENSARPVMGTNAAYFALTRPLYAGALLVLPAGRGRTVRHLAQLTNVAPELAPAGYHLLSATILDHRGFDDATLLASAQTEIEEIFPDAAGALHPLRLVRVPHALRAQPPGFLAHLRPPATPNHVFLAGDQTGPASLQSAMESGERAAKILLSV